MLRLPTKDDYEVLESVKLENLEIRIYPGDMHVGPRIEASADLGGLLYGGSINLLIALNEGVQRPLSLIVTFRGFDGYDSPIGWQVAGNATLTVTNPLLYVIASEDVPAVVTKITDTIIRTLAMRAIPGYNEHAEELHRAYVGFADV